MSIGKLKVVEWLHARVEAAVHKLLRPYVGRLMEEMAEKLAFEGECEDEDIHDCGSCEHHGDCPYEPQTIYQAPPGFVLVRRGPPPGPHELN
jgi:hypothetical protein